MANQKMNLRLNYKKLLDIYFIYTILSNPERFVNSSIKKCNHKFIKTILFLIILNTLILVLFKKLF